MKRRNRREPPADAEPGVDQVVFLKQELAKAQNELRDTARERDQLRSQVRSGALLLAAARRQCAEGCEHAKLARQRLVQLVEMQKLVDELRAANRGWDARERAAAESALVAVPGQRGGKRR